MIIIERDRTGRYAHEQIWIWMEVDGFRIKVGEICKYKNSYIFLDLEYWVGETFSHTNIDILLAGIVQYYEEQRARIRKAISIRF